jgi:tripartite-type tricarboxylate transporter receptor subunit TctC
MKKLFAILSIFLSSAVYAQKTVPIYWPFAAGSSQANMIRSIIDSANSQQNKYQFVFQHRPGAGGAVAANAAIESKELSILASTSSFFIRPLLYKESHNVEDFAMLSLICSSQPLAIFSKKINSLSEIQDREVSIGIIPGSITTLATRSLKRENPNLKILEVPYKGTPEATSDMLGGHIDGSVDFIGTSVTTRFGNDVKVLGITGTRNIGGYNTFQSQKIRGLENVNNDYYFFVSKTIDLIIRQELHKILNNAISDKTKAFCEDDYGQLVKIPYSELDSINQQHKAKWNKITEGILKQ